MASPTAVCDPTRLRPSSRARRCSVSARRATAQRTGADVQDGWRQDKWAEQTPSPRGVQFAARRLAPDRTPLRGNPAIPRTTRARLSRLPPEIKDGAASGLAALPLGGRFPVTADRHGTEGAVNQQAMPGATGRELKSVPAALASHTGGESHSGSVVPDLESVTETQLGPNSVCLHVRAEGPC